MLYILLVILTIVDGGKINKTTIVDEVDLIEYNTYIPSTEICLEQIIFYKFSPTLGRYMVIDWRTLKSNTQIPYKNGSRYTTIWKDSRDNVIREVHTKSYIRTYTNYDPELANQEYMERIYRPGLTTKPKK